MNDPVNESVEKLREDLRTEMAQQTAKLGWDELQRHFARGVVVCIAPELDLVDVAARFIADDKAFVESCLANGQITRPTTDAAARWHAIDANFWAVVAAPWVLVQEYTEN